MQGPLYDLACLQSLNSNVVFHGRSYITVTYYIIETTFRF